MGRNCKTKVIKTARRKNYRPGVTSSLAPSATLAGSSATLGQRDCEQCGNNMQLDGMAKAEMSVASIRCQICSFVAFRRSQRPCVRCTRTGCNHFCDWCGQGFHSKCAKLQNEDVSNVNGFCCHKCEAEQSEFRTNDEETKSGDSGNDVGSRCGSCHLPFFMAGKEPDDVKIARGFKVNQAVLVDNDEVLYNALITEVDTSGERIKIHFTRWSKSFDDWYAMDDEHINESLACDCCNDWFHIGCLPPIKSTGRWKDSTYVCPCCIDDARAFYHGKRSRSKVKAPYGTTSALFVENLKHYVSSKARESEFIADGDRKEEKLEDEERYSEDEERYFEDEERYFEAKRPKTSHKQIISQGVCVVDSVYSRDCAYEDSYIKKLKPAGSEAELTASLSSSRVFLPTMEATDRAMFVEKISESRIKQLKTPAVDADATVSANTAIIKRATPEYTIKVAAEARSSPSKAVAAKIGASSKALNGGTEADTLNSEHSLESMSFVGHISSYSSCSTVMSLLNSSPPDEKPIMDLSPVLTSMSALAPVKNRNDIPASSVPARTEIAVKIEQRGLRSSLCPSFTSKFLSEQAGQRKGLNPSTKLILEPQLRVKTSPTEANYPGISAFDILREVASQEIDDEASPVKIKREKRLTGILTNNICVSKRARVDASMCTSSTTSCAGRTGSTSVFSMLAASKPSQSSQTRERVQMNSFVDLHFSIRKEMYLRFCQLEEEGNLTRDSAHVLRSLVYPTSDRFQDLKFVYLVNKALSSTQLTKRLLEVVSYPVTRSSIANKNIARLSVPIGVFSTGLYCSPSSLAGSSHMGVLESSLGHAKPEAARLDDSSNSSSDSTGLPQSLRSSTYPNTAALSGLKG
ncbi:hypothetical protein CCR75_009752 [Bremia lactucae]|uniref:Uncharacterized protein n=1 Tax=Bremia lactucae TaxID=4779 RepID=A0A976IEX0_BRELC|nr:hypothetical protein CCR75_009752 [Bremia lactucae]